MTTKPPVSFPNLSESVGCGSTNPPAAALAQLTNQTGFRQLWRRTGRTSLLTWLNHDFGSKIEHTNSSSGYVSRYFRLFQESEQYFVLLHVREHPMVILQQDRTFNVSCGNVKTGKTNVTEKSVFNSLSAKNKIAAHPKSTEIIWFLIIDRR